MTSPTIGDRAWVTPAPDRRVRCPQSGGVLPIEGAHRTVDQYWLRRERDGDVTLGVKPATLHKSEPAKADTQAAPAEVKAKRSKDTK